MTMKPSDYIRQGWCQGVYARSARGNGVHEKNPHAVRWCMNGAFLAAYPDLNIYAKMVDFRTKSGIPRLAAWNDAPGRTQAEVLAVLVQHGY